MSAGSILAADSGTTASVQRVIGDAPIETANEKWTRRVILLSFWSVVILLGLPLWVWTTTVYRADLPAEVMNQWSDGHACRLSYPLHVVVSSPGQAQETITSLSSEVFEQLNLKGPPYLYYYQVSSEPVRSDADLNVEFSLSKSATIPTASLQSFGRQLNVQCDELSPACIIFAGQQIREIFADEQAAVRYLLQDTAYSTQLPPQDVLSTNLPGLEQRSIRAFKYASSYHLTFSLFTASASPSAWDIDTALQHYLNPLLHSLSSISNFTIDTQVQLFSSISPSIAGPNFDTNANSWMLQQSDLSGFINAAEWPLSPSIDGGSTINLVLYIPPADRSPLLVAGSSRNSWIIPQWGGVQILNRLPSAGDTIDHAELETIMYTFADQLTALVGLPPHPTPLQLRIDSLTRERLTSLILSASSTLGALDKLSKKLQSIAIPRSVAQSVASTISHLGDACRNLHRGHFQTALEHARIAEDAAEHAFFEPSMVGQVYFPDEHKVAVYVPLLGPMAVPLLMATLKEIKEWRKRKAKTS